MCWQLLRKLKLVLVEERPRIHTSGPKWVVSESDLPSNGDQAIYGPRTAHVQLETALGSKKKMGKGPKMRCLAMGRSRIFREESLAGASRKLKGPLGRKGGSGGQQAGAVDETAAPRRTSDDEEQAEMKDCGSVLPCFATLIVSKCGNSHNGCEIYPRPSGKPISALTDPRHWVSEGKWTNEFGYSFGRGFKSRKKPPGSLVGIACQLSPTVP
ncbi:hypothetical protein B0H13DRAFT_1928801 [Mycena leptocephala]|nr:hypothetical protein B0H13DRAFT_1928801 [Mycena leptocephala]